MQLEQKSSQNNGQVIIGYETRLRFKKKTAKKIKKKCLLILNFSAKFPKKKIIYTHKKINRLVSENFLSNKLLFNFHLEPQNQKQAKNY